MKKQFKTITLSLLVGFFCSTENIAGQAKMEGYVFEENNRGFLQQVKVLVYRLPENALLPYEIFTNNEGYFDAPVSEGKYRLVFKKDVFFDKTDTIEVGIDKVFLKVEMKRRPGYLLDATIAEARNDENQVVDAVLGATIEIYNRTQKKPELVLPQHKDAFFQFTFEQGNHYTILIRKPGFLAKRIEAYVNVKDCIICVNGVSNLRPGMTENLTAGNSMGTLLCNIEMEKVKLNKRIALQNIYYDYNKWEIRADAAEKLNEAVQLMLANPGISVELGSHTDARGSDSYNLELSQKRAESAVEYIISQGVDATRIAARGYGETQLTNRCKNGVNCSEEEHQKNRRTELRITGISQDSLEYLRWKSLEEIVREEEFRIGLRDLEKQQEVKIEERIPPKPEANHSTPLPKFEPEPAPKPSQKHENQSVEINSTQNTTENTLLVPPVKKSSPKSMVEDFTGFAVEIARTDVELNPQHPIFQQHGEVRVQIDAEGMFCYFIGAFDNQAVAKNYFQTIALPKYPNAKLCSFIRGVKNYQR